MATYPVNETMCSTCPWRVGSPGAFLRAELEEASFKSSRICHSTGEILVEIEGAKRVSDTPRICRGSRNFQLQVLCGIGFLDEPTDEAWEKKAREIEAKKGSNGKSNSTIPTVSSKKAGPDSARSGS